MRFQESNLTVDNTLLDRLHAQHHNGKILRYQSHGIFHGLLRQRGWSLWRRRRSALLSSSLRSLDRSVCLKYGWLVINGNSQILLLPETAVKYLYEPWRSKSALLYTPSQIFVWPSQIVVGATVESYRRARSCTWNHLD